MNPTELILSKLPDAKRSGAQQWEARCPSHEDRQESLCIGTGDDGRALLKCQAGCETRDVISALGLSMKDLMPTNGNGHATKSRIAEVYDYRDETDTLLFQVVRFVPKDFRQRKPNDKGGWEWNTKGVRKILYRLQELRAADPAAWVFVVEGEKDVENIRKMGLIATCNPGGAGKWRLVDDTPLHGRRVAVLVDKDEPGRKHGRDVFTSLHGKAADVRILDLPGEGKDVSDWLADDHGACEDLGTLLVAMVEAAKPVTISEAPEQAEQADGDIDRPIIVCNDRELCHKTADTLQALHNANDPPSIFRRRGELVRVEPDDHGRPIIRTLSVDALRGRLSEVAVFANITTVDAKPKIKAISPPLDVTKCVASTPGDGFPVLTTIVESPVFKPDGTLLLRPGYDADLRLLLAPTPGLSISVSESPTQADAQQAGEFITTELLTNFPLIDNASRANMVGTLLTPLVRPMIDGQTPMATMTAPAAGTGKTLLANLVSIVATGRPGAMMAAPRRGEEWNKTISAALDAGRSIIVFDNVSGMLQSRELDAAITAPIYTGRKLGTSEMPEYRVRVSWLCNGNNIVLGGDLPRRCYLIRLDAATYRPELRTGFRHADLIGWAIENRGRLLSAMMTMVRAWVVAGRPKPTCSRLGGFEEFCNVVGGVLEFAGVTGFLGTWAADREESDVEGPQWEAFLSELLAVFKSEDDSRSQKFTTADVAAQIPQDDQLREALPDGLADAFTDPKRSFTRVLGWSFKSIKGRRFDKNGIRVEVAGDAANTKVWLVRVDR